MFQSYYVCKACYFDVFYSLSSYSLSEEKDFMNASSLELSVP